MVRIPMYVAPHAGAWIETWEPREGNVFYMVAPHAGAWIETGKSCPFEPLVSVAPHAGAWIETKSSTDCRHGLLDRLNFYYHGQCRRHARRAHAWREKLDERKKGDT